MDRFHREGWEADGDVFGASFLRGGVADPLAGVGDDGLSGGDVEGTDRSIRTSVLDAQQSLEHNRELGELWSLAGFEPALRAAHVGDAGASCLGVDAADVFVDKFGLVAGGLNARRPGNECGHGVGFQFSASG